MIFDPRVKLAIISFSGFPMFVYSNKYQTISANPNPYLESPMQVGCGQASVDAYVFMGSKIVEAECVDFTDAYCD